MKPRTGSIIAVTILALGVVASAGWFVVAPSVLAVGASSGVEVKPLTITQASGNQTGVVVAVAESFQRGQPRDPFAPLVAETPPDATLPGGGTTVPGVTTPGGGTVPVTTSPGFVPGGQQLTLVAISTVGGVPEAIVRVDSTEYRVNEGESFAGSFQVVSLDDDSGVFLFGDRAFTLAVGQQILK